MTTQKAGEKPGIASAGTATMYALMARAENEKKNLSPTP